jgi:hypothetical protein
MTGEALLVEARRLVWLARLDVRAAGLALKITAPRGT